MKTKTWFLALLGIILANTVASAEIIQGAGATFPYPLYSKWAKMYETASGIKINYQSIGSGGGITQIKANTVDFGASDMPLSLTELSENNLIQFPTVMGGVVPVINIRGIPKGALKLTPEVFADIFLGIITNWNDERIKQLNPGINLPSQKITVVHRADGSGTTWIFTNYLSKVSQNWRKSVGCATSVSWKCGVGGKGNEGVAAYVARIAGAIGYVEYAYAVQTGLTYIKLQNASGNFVIPDIKTFQAAAKNASLVKERGFYEILTNQSGANSWPITGASFILIRKDGNLQKRKAVLDFFGWCYKNGNLDAVKLHYVPMPETVKNEINSYFKSIRNR